MKNHTGFPLKPVPDICYRGTCGNDRRGKQGRTIFPSVFPTSPSVFPTSPSVIPDVLNRESTGSSHAGPHK